MAKSGKKAKSAKPKKRSANSDHSLHTKRRRKIQFELVVPPNFLDMMYESMASEQFELDHDRVKRIKDYIR
jgi:hypothetical protein